LSDEDALIDRVSRAIHPRCEMYAYAASQLGSQRASSYYFDAAHQLVAELHDFLENEGLACRTARVLDFAAGYGRFTRFFVELFAEVVASDLDPEMLAFAREEFAVDGFLSSPDPQDLSPEPRFDLVFCFSLFTHLPESTWEPWLRRLSAFVRPGGWLVFSTRSFGLDRETRRARGREQDRPRLFGKPQASILAAGRESLRRRLGVYGLRLALDAGMEGVIVFRLDLRSSVPLRIERLALESPAISGLELGPPIGELVGVPDAVRAIDFRVPFRTDVPLRDAALGAFSLDLCLGSPGVVETNGCIEPLDFELRDDFRFTAVNETDGRLAPGSYGSTTVSHAFVLEAAQRTGRLELVRHFPGGELDRHQDLYAFRARDEDRGEARD